MFWIFQSISQTCFFEKNCWNPPFLSYIIVTYTKRKQISIVSSFIIAKNVQYCARTSQAWKCTAGMHIASHYQSGFWAHIETCYCTSHLCKLWPHIASHALVKTQKINNCMSSFGLIEKNMELFHIYLASCISAMHSMHIWDGTEF